MDQIFTRIVWNFPAKEGVCRALSQMATGSPALSEFSKHPH